MPKAGPAGSVSEKALRAWARSHPSTVADARLDYMDQDGRSRFLTALKGRTRIRPRVLISAQASGRWSTTGPNVPGRPREYKYGRDVIRPDVGTYWLAFDHQAVEAWIAAAYAGERRDLDPLERGDDLHLATAQDMFPGEGLEKTDPRRQQAKTARYNLQYSYDERGILDAPDLSIFGGRDGALRFARAYIGSRPALWAAKNRVFADCIRTHVAYSAFGRPRHLTGDDRTQAKDGWSHMIQGTVSSVMNRLLLRIFAEYPDSRLIVNEHDGATLAFPDSSDPSEVCDRCRELAGRPWDLWGAHVSLPTDWRVVRA